MPNTTPASYAERTARREVGRFFGIVLVSSVPFYALATVSTLQLLPGVPLSVFSVVLPALTAWFISRSSAFSSPSDLRKQCLEPNPLGRVGWYLLAFTLYPTTMVLDYAVRTAMGETLPSPDFALANLAALLGLSIVAAWFEELGWTAYATRTLRIHHGPLSTAFVVGGVWTVWHWVPLWGVGRELDWIGWWSLHSLACRVVLVHLFDRSGGSLCVCTVFHAMLNVTWQLYPIQASSWEPRSAALWLSLVALILSLCSRRAAGDVRRALNRGRASTPAAGGALEAQHVRQGCETSCPRDRESQRTRTRPKIQD